MTGQPCCPDYVTGGTFKGPPPVVDSSPDCVFSVPKMMEDYFYIPEAAKPLLSGTYRVTWENILNGTQRWTREEDKMMNPAQKFLKDREDLVCIIDGYEPQDAAEAILAAGWTAPDEV